MTRAPLRRGPAQGLRRRRIGETSFLVFSIAARMRFPLSALTIHARQRYDAGMAIQFSCPSCSQPIEVDEGWAQKTVACPYCRGTVTAPAASTLTDLGEIPVAAPFGGSNQLPPVFMAMPSSNPLALVAFGLTTLMIVLLTLSTYVIASHSLEVAELEKEIRKHGTDPASQLSALMEYAKANGGQFPAWLMAAGMMQIGGLVVCAAALTCALLAVRHRARRGLAIGSLVACGAVVLIVTGSILAAIG